MAPRLGRIAIIGAAIGMLVLTSGCARIREHQGHMLDQTLVAAIQPGVDNRDSVTGTLGRPTFVGQFDQRDWYYVSRDTRQVAFAMPKPVRQTVLHIRFDGQGNVASVERTGLERVVSIQPMDDKTPTLGRDRSFFQELFSNVGQVGSLAGAGTGGQGQ
jgi:outer membrane protein assembly factor BamE (lipoprotein component of BamABCDE complex)